MGATDNTNNNQVVNINANTQIVFTVKSFLSTIGSILAIIASFYFIVIVPSLKQSNEIQKTLYEEQKEYIKEKFKSVSESIDANTNAIKINTKAIKSNNDRFRDLNESVEDIANSAGSFGVDISTAMIEDSDPQ